MAISCWEEQSRVPFSCGMKTRAAMCLKGYRHSGMKRPAISCSKVQLSVDDILSCRLVH
jgi:hypothetical protein